MMTKLAVLIAFCLFSLIADCFALDVVLISQTAHDNSQALGGAYYDFGQTFLLSDTTTISKWDIRFGAKVGTPSSTVTYRVETTTAGAPSGTLADAGLTGTFTAVENSVVTVDLTDTSLASGTYAFVTDVGGTGENYWEVRHQEASPPYADGSSYYRANGGGSWTDMGRDQYFVLYKFAPKMKVLIID